jgi:hypothetical protein
VFEPVYGIWIDRSGRIHCFLSKWLEPLPDVEGLNTDNEPNESFVIEKPLLYSGKTRRSRIEY